jgi:hypothetical protein
MTLRFWIIPVVETSVRNKSMEVNSIKHFLNLCHVASAEEQKKLDRIISLI